jgi:phosphoribosyl-ATP pyrophosphohydrolase
MEQAIHIAKNEPAKTVEIVVHIPETLGEERRKDLVAALKSEKNIVSAEFCPLRYHLMLVRYDRDLSSSQNVLSSVKAQNYNARLIGPV